MSLRLFCFAFVLACLVGCHGDDAPVKAEAPTNPSGKPRTEQEAKIASAQEEAGERAKQQAAKAAAEMKAAKAKAGAGTP